MAGRSDAAGDRRVALVTGAGRGIGRAVAAALAGRGDRVAIVDRHRDRAEQAASEVGGGALALVADLQDPEAISRMAEELLARCGRWDVLVNNVGALTLGGVEDTTLDQWRSTIDSCVTTAWLCIRAAVPAMRGAGGGRIVNITSVVVEGADSTGLLAYTVGKAALAGLTRAAARELGPDGITVNAVSPGAVDTERFDSFPDADARRAERAARTVIGRLAEPAEIAAAVAYLCSAEAAYVTGQTLVVDGGRVDKL